MKKLITINLILIAFAVQVFSQTKLLDEITFGNASSEKKHAFSERETEVVKGGLNESARLLMPIEGERVEGGNMTFKMKVDPDKQNYFTARFWGGDTGNKNYLILFIDGKQIGYRHLGDYDMLSIANEDAPFVGRFTYTTLPLPIHMTKGKTEVDLCIRSTGPIFRYGETFDSYQKPMVEPTKGVYKVYTHVNPYFSPSKKEKQGVEPAEVLRPAPGEEVIDEVKDLVNSEIDKMLKKDIVSMGEIQLLAEAYYIPWTKAYHNKRVIEQTIAFGDDYYKRLQKEGKKLYWDSWVTTGPFCIAVYLFTPEIRPLLDVVMENGRTRRENWTEVLKACVDFSTTHRRSYTNQSMIVDLFTYHVNRTLAIINPDYSLPNYQTLRYLYESMGIAPWLGSETLNGPSLPLGDNYLQLTDKGLTKELGFVGGYGEIVHWMNHIYNATGEIGLGDSRDALIRDQMIKMYKARCYFRYPSVDNDGYKAMRGESVIGWRDPYPYPGDVLYGEKGYTREAGPFTVVSSVLDPELVAYAQQMMDDNQFFSVVKGKMSDRGTNSIHSLLKVPGEYEKIKAQPRYEGKLPMSKGMPNVVFSDEEIGVVAIKNGEELFYASLYWRANYAINFLARIHYITPEIDRIATIFEDVKYTDSGMIYKRPERVNLHFSDARNFYPDVKSAHTGEELPIAKIPEGVKFSPGSENVYAGKGDFYTLRYGKYLIGMNCTKNRSFEFKLPQKEKVVDFLTGERVLEPTLSVEPMTTRVFIVD